jgi:L-Ala-D/L-Glu epimerase
MMAAARALGLVVMIGCMIESSAGIAPAAQISSLCDFVDLDGHLLLAEDPFEGLGLEDGALVLSTAPGLGVSPRV